VTARRRTKAQRQAAAKRRKRRMAEMERQWQEERVARFPWLSDCMRYLEWHRYVTLLDLRSLGIPNLELLGRPASFDYYAGRLQKLDARIAELQAAEPPKVYGRSPAKPPRGKKARR